MICTSLGNIAFEKALVHAREDEMIELRADLLGFDMSQLQEIIRTASRTVFTCREGVCSREERRRLFEMAVGEGAGFIDLEIESAPSEMDWLKSVCEGKKTEIIMSWHNYEHTPGEDELKDILKDCYNYGADVAKIACMVNEDQDLVRLLGLYRKKGRKIILGMGEKGILTRVAALAMGAEFSFAAPDSEKGTAPGQLSLREMKEIRNILKL